MPPEAEPQEKQTPCRKARGFPQGQRQSRDEVMALGCGLPRCVSAVIHRSPSITAETQRTQRKRREKNKSLLESKT